MNYQGFRIQNSEVSRKRLDSASWVLNAGAGQLIYLHCIAQQAAGNPARIRLKKRKQKLTIIKFYQTSKGKVNETKERPSTGAPGVYRVIALLAFFEFVES